MRVPVSLPVVDARALLLALRVRAARCRVPARRPLANPSARKSLTLAPRQDEERARARVIETSTSYPALRVESIAPTLLQRTLVVRPLTDPRQLALPTTLSQPTGAQALQQAPPDRGSADRV